MLAATATATATAATALAQPSTTAGDGGAAGARPPLLDLLETGGGDDVVAFDSPRPGGARLQMAARVQAPVARLAALLADPEAYRRAIPAFVRAEPLRTEAQPGGGQARLLAWELEIPLWNLKGRLWMRQRPDGVELELAEGDLTPGRLRLRALPDGTAAGSILVIEGSVNVRNANFVTRRLAARDPLAEPAMTATATYVLLRALALEAGRTGQGPLATRRPAAAMRAPAVSELQPGKLARRLATVSLGSGAALAVVRSRPDGRLLSVEVALGSRLPASSLQARLAEAWRWRALPGWKHVEARATAPDGRTVWEVDSNLPFVDFDADWTVHPGLPFRASADGGDWRGPVMAWEVVPAAAPTDKLATLAAHALHPHLERTGYLPRKLIEAEPLLEHGLALGLAYVNAFSLLKAVSR